MKTNGGAVPQHAVHLAEQPAQVRDLRQRAVAERDVDRVGAQEREVGEVAGVQLESHFGGFGGRARVGDAVRPSCRRR